MKKLWVFLGVIALLTSGCSDDSGAGTNGGGGGSQVTGVKALNLLGPGDSANDFLSNDNYDRLIIQVQYVTGFRPSNQVFSDLEDFIREFTFKDDIEFNYKAMASPGQESLTFQEIRQIEENNRTFYNDGSTLTLYIYFADAPAEGDDLDQGLVSLGAVYRNTSMVIFESTIRTASQILSVPLTDFEKATLRHEFGHLFGLVNIGSPFADGIDHEDPSSSSHCSTAGCLMRAELEFGAGMAKAMKERVSKGMASIPEFSDRCLADMEANGGRPAN